MDIVDYTEAYNRQHKCNPIAVHGFEKDVLILSGKLKVPRKRIDGKMGAYILEHCWLTERAESENDEAYVCVKGSDYLLLTQREARAIRRGLANGDTLFDHMSLI